MRTREISLVVMKMCAVNKLSELLKYFGCNTRDVIREISGERSFASFSEPWYLWVNLHILLLYSLSLSIGFEDIANMKYDFFLLSFINTPIQSFNQILWTLFKELRYIDMQTCYVFTKLWMLRNSEKWIAWVNTFYRQIQIYIVLKGNVTKNIRNDYFLISWI